MSDTPPRRPGVSYMEDKKKPESILVVTLKIDGIKKGSFFKKSNGEVYVKFPTDEKFHVTAEVTNSDASITKWEMPEITLPGPVDTDKSNKYEVVKDGKVEIKLYKKYQGTWASALAGGLDQS